MIATRSHNPPRTVVVTGGGRGIGAEITRAFVEHGDRVAIASRTETALAKELGEQARWFPCDVRSEQGHLAVATAAVEWTGRLDVYVNCAGYSAWRPLHDVDADFWDQMIDTNLRGTMWGCKTAARFLGSGGCIINVSSLAGKRGSANNAVYCASKFGVNGLTQAAAKELGARGIRVNAVCPVYVRTEGLEDALRDERSPTGGADVSMYLEDFAATASALGRLPEGREVAGLCVYLASGGASAITGQCINVDCGVLPQ